MRYVPLFGLLFTLLYNFQTIQAQDNLTNVPDPDPAVQEAALRIADGFEVNLFVSDPMIDKPIQMAWDEQGRLWLATSNSYPQPLPGQTPNDKIFVVEDVDGDGKADKSTVFADGLLTPTGIAVGRGGVYVANSTEILHLRDTDGDNRADERSVILSGFGADDTHHLIHTFRWGPDGMLYINQSIYIFSHIETPWGIKRLRGGGIWHYDPDTRKLDVLSYGMVNPWGHIFDGWGQSFATDGAFGEGINYVFPGATFVTAHGAERILPGLNQDQPKHAGLAYISGRHFPEDWQGHMVTNDFRANRVNVFDVTEREGSYHSEPAPDLIWTDHVAFRPVDASVGPDGALYIVDWYNPIIQHGEVDFRDPRRDHQHGRVWRITAQGRPLVDPPELVGGSVETLLNTLIEPEQWSRIQAKRLLKERGAEEVKPILDTWVARWSDDTPAHVHARLEALWTYQAINVVVPVLLDGLLVEADHRARAAAMRVLYHWRAKLPEAMALAERGVQDPHPRVRREALHVLERLNSPEAAHAALQVLNLEMDSLLDYALWYTMRETAGEWVPHLRQYPDFFGPDDSPKLRFALRAISEPYAAHRLTELYLDGHIPLEEVKGVEQDLSRRMDTDALRLVYDAALVTTEVETQVRYWKLLEAVAIERSLKPAGDVQLAENQIRAANPEVKPILLRLAGLWGLETVKGVLERIASQRQASEEERRAALEGLAALQAETYLASYLTQRRPQALKLVALKGLATLNIQTAAREAVRLANELPTQGDPLPFWTPIVEQEEGPQVLAEAIQENSVSAVHAQKGYLHIRNRNRRYGALRDALLASGATAEVVRLSVDMSPGRINRLERQVKVRGDVEKGKTIYERPVLQCVACHAIEGIGGTVGPDLSTIGVQAPMDYLITSLVKPGQAVKDGYVLVQVTRKDGTVVAGNLTSETSEAVVIQNTAGESIRIPVEQVAERKILPGSLMPEGLVLQLTEDEFIDLVAFLSSLGETIP